MKGARNIARIYSGIFFGNDAALGITALLATFWSPNAGLAGLLAVASAWAFAKMTDRWASAIPPHRLCNSLLVGLSIGALFRLSPATMLLVVCAAILAYVLAVGIEIWLGAQAGLPALSLPFVLVSGLVHLASLRDSGLVSGELLTFVPVAIEDLPRWLNGYLLALGAIVFSGHALAGLLIAAALLRFSRIAFVLSVLGYATGAMLSGRLQTGLAGPFENLNYFNYILVAIALGGVFLVPSASSFLIALFGVAATHVVLHGTETLFGAHGVPVLTLPFNFTVLAFVYYAGHATTLRPRSVFETPEESLDHHRNHSVRFGLSHPAVAPPFAGRWIVSQAFSGPYTHKGPWRFGLDFVVVGEDGSQCDGAPSRPEDFHCFAKPVLAPVAGRVVAVEATCRDNSPGKVERGRNWGNLVTIEDHRGFFVTVSHLQAGSVLVAPGMWVAQGQPIGRCGSSGYAPFPHIHLQVQKKQDPASETIEFRLEQAVRNGRFEEAALPVEGDAIEATHISRKLSSRFELLLGETFVYEMLERGRSRRVELKVELDPAGATYLTDGVEKLWFEIRRMSFRFYRFEGSRGGVLGDLFAAMPSIPLCDGAVSWSDSSPLRASVGAVLRELIAPLTIFFPRSCEARSDIIREGDRLTGDIGVRVFGRCLASGSWKAEVGRRKFIESLEMRSAGATREIRLVEYREAGATETNGSPTEPESGERMVAA